MNLSIKPIPLTFIALLATSVLPMCRSTPTQDTASTAAQKLFTDDIKPILEKNCLACHSGANPTLLNLSNHASPFLPGPSGRAYIVPGKPDQSLLLEAVSRQGLHQRMMPRLQVTLTDMEIGTLREWIEAGAPWPNGPPGQLHPQPNPEQP